MYVQACWNIYLGKGFVLPFCFSLVSSEVRDKANVAHVLFIIGFFWSKTLHFDPFQDLSSSSDMRPAHHTLFRDQVSTLVEWFSHWNDCERTIALYTLLMRISTIQAKFLSLILEHTYREDSYEVQVMQKRANDKGKFHTWVEYFCLLLLKLLRI